jgi:hypothetical protein
MFPSARSAFRSSSTNLTALLIASSMLGACVVPVTSTSAPAAPVAPTPMAIADGEYALRTSTGHYLVAEDGGGGDANANRVQVGPWERFTVVNVGGGKVALRTINGHYVVAENGGGAELHANRTEVGPWEQFAIEGVGNGEVALRTISGHLVVAEGGGGGEANANRTEVGPWERFTLVPLPPIVTEDALLGRAVSLRSSNVPDRYVRHADHLGQLSPIASSLERSDASFRVVPGLAGDGTVSLESVNYPGHFLRHQGFRIKLHADDGSQLFRDDASFHVVSGLAAADGISLESVNYEGRFLRHRDFELWLEPADDDLSRADATFHVTAPFAAR